jgi:hypothetical protein
MLIIVNSWQPFSATRFKLAVFRLDCEPEDHQVTARNNKAAQEAGGKLCNQEKNTKHRIKLEDERYDCRLLDH